MANGGFEMSIDNIFKYRRLKAGLTISGKCGIGYISGNAVKQICGKSRKVNICKGMDNCGNSGIGQLWEKRRPALHVGSADGQCEFKICVVLSQPLYLFKVVGLFAFSSGSFEVGFPLLRKQVLSRASV